MAAKNLLTVRLPEADLEKLERLARLQKRPKSGIVQEAIASFLASNDELQADLARQLKDRLQPAIDEQCELLNQVSVADEHRRF